jgi:hypothetical protein
MPYPNPPEPRVIGTAVHGLRVVSENEQIHGRNRKITGD